MQGQTGEDCGTYDYEVTVDESFAEDHEGFTIVATNTGRITITPKPLSSTMLAAITETYTYDGTQKKPTPTVSYQNGWNDAIDRIINNAPTVENITVFSEGADEETLEDIKKELEKVLDKLKERNDE